MRDLRNQGSKSDDEDTWKWKETPNRAVDLLFWGDEPGPTNRAIGVTEPLDFFHLLSEDFYDKLLVETNCYANQQRQVNNDHSPWNPVSKEELMAFIGFVIAMGIVSLPSINDYWSTEPMHYHSLFRLIMPRDLFLQILHYIHVVDSTTAPQYDKLRKVRPLIDCLGKVSNIIFTQ